MEYLKAHEIYNQIILRIIVYFINLSLIFFFIANQTKITK